MFITDYQTQQDIGLFGNSNRIYELYASTLTRGGGQVLEEWLRYPLSDEEKINRRTGIIQYFLLCRTAFPFGRELFDAAEQYLSERDERTRLVVQQQSIGQKLSGLVAGDTQYKNIVKGIVSLIELLQQLQAFIRTESASNSGGYLEEREIVQSLLSQTDFTSLLSENIKNRITQAQLAAYDSVLRFRCHTDVRKLMQFVYHLDAYISLGKTAMASGFCFATAAKYSGNTTKLELEDVRHPLVAYAKGNSITINNEKNILFLTGANMAGKSTFMKSVGIAVYLAHCGFPVAAKYMNFTALDGMFSTINLPDNLGTGASYFYAEALRVKKVAQELHAGKRLFVLFDELFRGTNVKDAKEATVAIVEGFAKKTNSLFIISTHIIEAGDELKQKSGNIQYRFLPTKMEAHQPVYTYQLEEGITEDRHGMVIIRNEKIIEMLERNLTKRE